MSERKNWVALIIAAIAVAPSFLLASLYYVAFRVVVIVRHWPYLGNPDASAMPDDLQPGSGPGAVGVPLTVYAASVALFAALVIRYTPRSRRVLLALAAGAVTWLVLVGFFIWDPAGVWQWIMD
jgi:hypothetical protein